MKHLKDNQLVWRVKVRRCDTSLLELINRHTPLFYKISQKYFPFAFRGGNSQTVDDIIGSSESIIYESILEFKASKKVKYSTWLGNFVRYRCLNYLNKNSKMVDAEEGKLNFFFQKKSLEEYNKITRSDDHFFINNLIDQFKDDRMKKVFELRYFSGEKKMTWVKIGDRLAVSAQTAINLHNKGKNIIKKKMQTDNGRYAYKIL
jgi:RNA polymerase sigma factor (sigma-70 family)